MFAKGIPTTITHLPKSSEKLIPLKVFDYFQCFEFRIISVHPNFNRTLPFSLTDLICILGGIKISPTIFACPLNSANFTKPLFLTVLVFQFESTVSIKKRFIVKREPNHEFFKYFD
jgi:hypothetical protein